MRRFLIPGHAFQLVLQHLFGKRSRSRTAVQILDLTEGACVRCRRQLFSGFEELLDQPQFGESLRGQLGNAVCAGRSTTS